MKYNEITKSKEMELVNSENYKLGEFIYMGMAKIGDKTVCISVAYKIDYCERKAKEFEELTNNVKFSHINKIKTGELQAFEKFYI